ncbi:MAG: endonuclease [Candidatus Omnitrophica bacterium CG07_land_8_20_14_0_80_42_15]|uniref:Endonuclease n=1 Tax=Candidatus Aquitaenariimonas noxiae TaxID=1974741 RepID=A0A2J0KSG2_9BACT|nr:MAG: endonuclease [Candidatus Omnitrophica bacterium CG07_land_8_20_14_0_80_42_15]
MYYVYLIKASSNGKIYIGHTSDLKKRLVQHNSGYSRATKSYREWSLVYSEKYSTRCLAMKREKYLKSGDGRKALKLRGIV